MGCRFALVLWVSLGLLACAEDEQNQSDGFDWQLPSGFPIPKTPEDNPISPAKVELGRFLFYDTLLSVNRTQSCATCHHQALAFSDGIAQPQGATGDTVRRNSMSLANVAYNTSQTWANPILEELERQALIPLFGENPIELGMAGLEAELAERLSQEERYRQGFPKAFPEAEEFYTVAQVVQAIASFQRTLISGNSAYDRWLYQDDSSAMSASALRGMDLFFSERLECFHCHGGFNFSQSSEHDGTVFDRSVFHNTGLYNVDGKGAYPVSDKGLYEVSEDPQDMGAFRAPTLRNIMLSAPYMHDGSIATIDAVLDHYARGGRKIEDGPNAGDGRRSPLKSSFVRGFSLTPDERVDLKAFLESLTDLRFIEDPRFSNPYESPK